MFVLKKPGPIELTIIPNCAYVAAIAIVIPLTAPFDVL
jgi:hypothetical protein